MLKNFNLERETKSFANEINLRKVKWLLNGCITGNYQLYGYIKCHRQSYSKLYDRVLLVGDLSAQISNVKLDAFCSGWNLKSSGKEPTCFCALICNNLPQFVIPVPTCNKICPNL